MTHAAFPPSHELFNVPESWARDSFSCASLRETRNRLMAALADGSPLVTLTGPRGIGKSGIASWVLESLDPGRFDVFSLALLAPERRAGWLWVQLARYLGTGPDERLQAVPQTADVGRLQDSVGAGRRLVIRIEGAEFLHGSESLTELQGLLNLRSLLGAFVTLVAVVDTDALVDAGTVQKILDGGSTIVVGRMSTDEMRQYVEWRLGRAGHDLQSLGAGLDLNDIVSRCHGDFHRLHAAVHGALVADAGSGSLSGAPRLRDLLPESS